MIGLVGPVAAVGCKDPVGTPAPVTVTAVSPAIGPLAGGTSLTITGTNFANVTSVTIGGVELVSRTVLGDAQITGTTAAGTGLGTDVVVISSTHGSATCSGCFSYLLPVLAQPLAASTYHTCARTSSGATYCWGLNDEGEFGDGSTASRSTPVAVLGALTFSSIAAGALHTCGLSFAGAAYCWGRGDGGQLGDSSATNSSTPVAVSGGLALSAITAGHWHTCGLTTAGAAYCWGENDRGQLGNDSTTSSSTPVAVSGGLTFSTIGAGLYYTCGLTLAGAAYCWGANGWGQLGNGSRTSSSTPVAVSTVLRFSILGTGGVHACALTSSGAAYCWGSNSLEQLGTGAATGPETCLQPGPHPPRGNDDCSTVPTKVATALRWGDLRAGLTHTCGLTPGGQAYCWGEDYQGELGDGSTGTTSSTPVAVSGGLTFRAIAAGSSHTCGLTTAGAAYCWGDNYFGQLGDGTTTSSATPVAVSGWPPP